LLAAAPGKENEDWKSAAESERMVLTYGSRWQDMISEAPSPDPTSGLLPLLPV
jgi:hypothetical protein